MAQRILYVSPIGQIGGAERSLLDLIDAVDRRRFEPVVVCLQDGPLAERIRRSGVFAAIIPAPGHFLRLSFKGRRRTAAVSALACLPAARTIARLRQFIRQHSIVLVHANGIKAHLIAGPAGRLSSTPVIWHLRDLLGDGFQERLLLGVGSACAKVIVANSEATRRSVTARASCPVVTVHNGVDLHHFRPTNDGGSLRRELGVGAQTALVGMVGMLAPWKGQHVFLKAAAQVARVYPDAKFCIVGDEIYTTNGHGDYRLQLLALARDLGIIDRVVFAGYRDDIPRVMAALDVVVHASVQPEPFGRVLIEGMAAGKAVIATRGGGTTEILADGETGLLVAPGDAQGLAGGIARLVGDGGLRDTLGQRARQHVERSFSITRHAEAISGLYTGILEAH